MAPKNKMAALKALAVSAAEKSFQKDTGTTSKAAAASPAVKVLNAQPIHTVLAEDAGEEDDEPLSARKRRKMESRPPLRSGAQDRAKNIVDLSERSDLPPRKSKSEKKHKTAPFDPKEFMNTKAEAFKADPFRVSLSVFARMTELVEADKKDAALKLKDVENKYEAAKKALEPLRTDLEKSEEVVAKLKKEKEDWEIKKKELEDELLKAKSQADMDAAELKKRNDRIAELEASLPLQDVSELTKQIEELTNQRDQAVELGKEGISEAFTNALEQVAIVVPTFVADPDVFKPEYSVLDGHIVEFDPETDQVSRVIYPANRLM